MPRRLPRFSLKLAVAFFCTFAALIAQDPADFMTPKVLHVGDRLACRCGGCAFTVGSCSMLHCEYSDPMRRRIAGMLGQGMGEDAIVASIVREEGVVALSTPPSSGWGLLGWFMPAFALIAGFFVYTRWLRRNKVSPVPMTDNDRAMIDRYRAQIDREFGDDDQEHVK